MDLVLKERYSRGLYLPWLHYLTDYGEKVDVRGRETLEFLNAISIVTEPWHPCILIPSRRWNPWLALSEALWILGGRDDVASIEAYNHRIAEYSDNGLSLYGAYGPRIVDQIDDLVERLRRDPSDRRAVLSIWNKSDLTVESKDPPCNNLLYFKLRKEQLHMTVICRSNDLHWGLFAVNLPTFGILQQYIAARLNVGIGTQTHLSNSLHIYTDDKAATAISERMLYGREEMPRYPDHELCWSPVDFVGARWNHNDIAMMCNSVLNGDQEPAWQFLMFATDFLAQYKERVCQPEHIRFASLYPDWIAAGALFAEQVWKH